MFTSFKISFLNPYLLKNKADTFIFTQYLACDIIKRWFFPHLFEPMFYCINVNIESQTSRVYTSSAQTYTKCQPQYVFMEMNERECEAADGQYKGREVMINSGG